MSRLRFGSLRFRRGKRFGSHLGGGVLYGQAWPAYQIHEGVFRSCNSYPAVEEEEEEEILGFQGEGGLLPSSFNDPVSLVFAARVLHSRVGEGY